MKPVSYICFALTWVFPALLLAEKDTEIKPVLVKVGVPSQKESFQGKELNRNWSAIKGKWKIEKGTLVGKELPADKHAAVLTWKVPNRNSVIRCSFQLKDCNFFHLSLNHPKGHLFRVMIDSSGMSLRKDKNKKEPGSRSITLSRVNGKIEPGKWYTLQLEMEDDVVVAQIDNGLKVTGKHPGLDLQKTGYRFVMIGDALLIDDLKLWKLEK